MTFEEWWENYKQYCPIMDQEEMAEDAWKLAYKLGFDDGTNKEKQRYANWNDVYASQKIDSLEYELEIANDQIKMLEKQLYD